MVGGNSEGLLEGEGCLDKRGAQARVDVPFYVTMEEPDACVFYVSRIFLESRIVFLGGCG